MSISTVLLGLAAAGAQPASAPPLPDLLARQIAAIPRCVSLPMAGPITIKPIASSPNRADLILEAMRRMATIFPQITCR